MPFAKKSQLIGQKVTQMIPAEGWDTCLDSQSNNPAKSAPIITFLMSNIFTSRFKEIGIEADSLPTPEQ